MADWDVTAEMVELEHLGYIPAEVQERTRWLRFQHGRWLAGGRTSQTQVLQLLDEARANARIRAFDASVEDGLLCTWQAVSGTWVIRGRDLCEGDVVTVTRRTDGLTSLEMVGPIIAHLPDGTRLAKVGKL